MGQNFLFDSAALLSVAEVANLRSEESVLEIGAGVGCLTVCLAQIARRVVAVELDRRLLPALTEATQSLLAVERVQGDILALDPAELMGAGAPYAVVANIPYNITSAVIRHLLEATRKPDRIILTVQREVAERIIAGPGQMSLLALSVQIYGSPHIRARLAAGLFYPPPKVDSAVLSIPLHTKPVASGAATEMVFTLARAGFSQRRKQLRNALSAGLQVERTKVERWLESAGLEERSRAQELALSDWLRLAAVVQANPVESGG